MPSTWSSCTQPIPFQLDLINSLVQTLPQGMPLFSKGMGSALLTADVKALLDLALAFFFSPASHYSSLYVQCLV